MRISVQALPDGTARGYTMWLSARDTYNWAHRSGSSWPCSTVSDHRIRVDVDTNGLYDMGVDGRSGVDVDGTELDAIVSDHLPKQCRHLWPVWNMR